MRILLLCLMLFPTKSYEQFTFGKSIVYTKVYKVEKPKTYFSAFNRPDSLFLNVFFNDQYSLTFTETNHSSNIKEKFNELEEYNFINFDSLYIIEKKRFCDTPNKLIFQSYDLKPIPKDTTILSMKCTTAFKINKFGDTTIFYLTKYLPKAAGIIALKNFSECVIGFESRIMRIFPRSAITEYIEPVSFDFDLRSVDKKVVSQEVWLDGKFGEFEEYQLLPEFIATDMKKNRITNNSLKQNRNSVIIILNHLVECQTSNAKFSKFLSNQNAQNIDLLNAVSALVKEKITSCYVFTEDYFENIDLNAYPQLHIVPNAISWKNKMQILQTPLILIVQNNVIISKLSPFDFSEDEFYDGLKKRLVSKQKAISK